MSDEWPTAGWLSESIEAWVGDPETSNDAWASIERKIGLDDASPGDDLIIADVVESKPSSRGAPNGYRRFAASLAAVILVTAGGIIGWNDRRDDGVSMSDSANEVSPESTIEQGIDEAGPVAEIDSLHCKNLPPTPQEVTVAVEANRTPDPRPDPVYSVAVARSNHTAADPTERNHTDVGYLVLDKDPLSRQLASSRFGSVLEKRTMVGVVEVTEDMSAETIDEVLASIVDVACPTSTFYLVLGSRIDVDLLCTLAPAPGSGFAGYILVGDIPSPPLCAGMRPTMLVDNAGIETDEMAAWVEAHRCEDLATDTDTEDNRISTWGSCEDSLIHVETMDPDPWAATIDGETTARFIRRISTAPS